MQHTSVSPDRRLITVVGDHLDGLLVDSQNGKVKNWFSNRILELPRWLGEPWFTVRLLHNELWIQIGEIASLKTGLRLCTFDSHALGCPFFYLKHLNVEKESKCKPTTKSNRHTWGLVCHLSSIIFFSLHFNLPFFLLSMSFVIYNFFWVIVIYRICAFEKKWKGPAQNQVQASLHMLVFTTMTQALTNVYMVKRIIF